MIEYKLNVKVMSLSMYIIKELSLNLGYFLGFLLSSFSFFQLFLIRFGFTGVGLMILEGRGPNLSLNLGYFLGLSFFKKKFIEFYVFNKIRIYMS